MMNVETEVYNGVLKEGRREINKIFAQLKINDTENLPNEIIETSNISLFMVEVRIPRSLEKDAVDFSIKVVTKIIHNTLVIHSKKQHSFCIVLEKPMKRNGKISYRIYIPKLVLRYEDGEKLVEKIKKQLSADDLENMEVIKYNTVRSLYIHEKNYAVRGIETLQSNPITVCNMEEIALHFETDGNVFEYYLSFLLSNFQVRNVTPDELIDVDEQYIRKHSHYEIIKKFFAFMNAEFINTNKNIIASAIYNLYEERHSDKALNHWKIIAGEYGVPNASHVFNRINEKYTIKTLAYIIRETHSTKHQYKRWHIEWVRDAIERAVRTPNDLSMARLFYRMNWLEFFFTSSSGFYMFKGTGSKSITKQTVKEEIRETVKSISNDEKLLGKTSIVGIEEYVSYEVKIRNLYTTLESKFEVNEDLLNIPDMLTAFTNVVTEVSIDETKKETLTLRNGYPEDYIRFIAPCKYNSDYSRSHPRVMFLLDWFKKALKHEEQVEYFLNFLSSLLKPGNTEKNFYIWYGPRGYNSKTKLMNLIENTYGENFVATVKADAYFHTRRGKSGPDPERAQLDGKRLATTSEPPAGVPIKSSLIKAEASGDKFFARKCRENGSAIKQTHKSVIQTNALPSIDEIDEAVMERLIVIWFYGKWLNGGVEDPEHDNYVIDLNFDDVIRSREIKEALIWLTIDNYGNYIRNGLKLKPRGIMEQNKQRYIENCNEFQKFIRCSLTKTKHDSDFVSVTDAYKRYKTWHRETNPDTKAESQEEFQKNISAMIGMIVSREYRSKSKKITCKESKIREEIITVEGWEHYKLKTITSVDSEDEP